ncbi:uncharacterized protein B3gp29 [Nephila pilipes]|uniref:Uncharacterized protein B3gp29 n=1 Tax=Nephila pilipes TaxID=299642 RepID=A0A8X6QEK7_NEPPI|nr:uncharacterized protein B3gp29 [Nephila pilipes]
MHFFWTKIFQILNIYYISLSNSSQVSILTQSGRAAIAASIKEQVIHLAWGSGDANWESSHQVEKVFVEGEIKLEHYPIKDGTAIPANSTVTIEYTEDTPPEPIMSKKLLNELGRRTVDEVLFCTGDENGELVTPSGRFRPSNVPTNNLFLTFTFDFTDAYAANQVIRELGVMVGTKLKKKVPPGQRYFEPQDIENPGILLVLEHTVPLIRTAATRETFSFVVTF